MLEDVEDREQFVAGFVFVATFLAVWLIGRTRYPDGFAVVLAGILSTATTVVYYGYVVYRRHRQEIAEWIDEHRYRFDRLAEALQRLAEQTGANRLVARVDARLEATVALLRDRLGDADAVEYPEIAIDALRFTVTGERPPEAGPGTYGDRRREGADGPGEAGPSRDGPGEDTDGEP